MEATEKLSEISNYLELNLKQLSEKLGYRTPQALYDIKKGNTKTFSEAFINKMLSVFPQFNRLWLLTGEGDMLKEPVVAAEPAPRADVAPASAVSFMVPLINIDSVGGVWSENDLTVSEQYVERMIPFDGARPGDAAIMQSGDSMDPIIPSGSVLHIRKVEQWREFLDYNCVYVLLLKDDRRITKLVRKFDEDPHNYILCCSYNPNNAPQELPRSFIREVWKVVNVLIPRGW